MWTAADQAELDVLLTALVNGVFAHRERCQRCADPTPCPHVQKAIAEVVDWHHMRTLLSRAQHLRNMQDAA